jgi:hypothetical protein
MVQAVDFFLVNVTHMGEVPGSILNLYIIHFK